MGLRMHFPLSFIAKRVDVSMGCQRCESHKLVMAAVAEMGPGQSLGHNYIKWWVNGCSCGGQLLVAVAACSWPKSRLAVGMQLRVLTRAE